MGAPYSAQQRGLKKAPIQAAHCKIAEVALDQRGVGKSGPYLGLGLGGHRLGWDAVRPQGGASSRLGVNFLGGVEITLGRGHWSMILEGGYQWVDEWGTGRIDASSMRSYLGLGRNF